ncbi:MAG: P63C domain-containing protein [Deltaproteobacteria bacterium]|nr:P63C domain-containing protein [Deltaproteobacteria bacterium]
MDGEIKGKAIGGRARAESLSPERRKEIAQKAARAKWQLEKESDAILKATHGSPDHPLRIGSIEIPCYVLEDKKRVLMQGAMLTSLDMKQGTAGRGVGDRIEKFLSTKAIKPYAIKYLGDMIINPIKFKTPSGSIAYGYEATILADICDAVLEARKEGKLHYQQEHIAKQCEILVRGFARVGIIALVDEATGYERDKARLELSKILEAFIAKELQPWIKTFDDEYYQELFRLRGLSYPTDTVQRPLYFGILTNDIVYRRLAPGVLDALKKEIGKNSKGRPKSKLFRKLTNDIGYPKLREHLASVITIMKLSEKYHDFLDKLDRIHPRYKDTQLLPFGEYEAKEDTGKGI